MKWRHLVLAASALLVGAALARDGDARGGGDWVRARSFLVRDAASSDADVCGHVEVRERGTRQRFAVEAENLAPGSAITVLVEDATAAMISAGSSNADFQGLAELELDTGDGESLPAGAATVDELKGRRVEVRDAWGGPLLSGVVGSLDGPAVNHHGKTRVRDDDSGARVKVEMRIRGRDGRQEFRFEVKSVAPNYAVELWILDGMGSMTRAAQTTTNGSGSARLRFDTRRGDGMPLDAPDLQDLAGRVFEVRMMGATVVASGALPSL
jgi:hypothetical protein